MCLGAIYWARPTRVFFAATHAQATAAGFDDSFIYQQLEVPGKDRSIPMVQVDSADANRPFEEWATHSGRVEY
jgi:guanine deaminase